MKRKIFIGILILLSFKVIIEWVELPFKESEVIGTYVNYGYKKYTCCVEAPHQPDTLKISSDGSFYSKYYGKGNYKLLIDYPFSSVKLISKDFSQTRSFEKKIFGNLKIVLNPDNKHCYVKIQSK